MTGRPGLRLWFHRPGTSILAPSICTKEPPQPARRRLGHKPSISICRWTPLCSFSHQHGSILKDPWLVLGGVLPDVSNPNIILYDFINSHLYLIKNEYVKLDETCPDTQCHFKVYLLNVVDVMKCLTSTLQETQYTAYRCYNNSFKYFKTS